jgi:hypothetical protein
MRKFPRDPVETIIDPKITSAEKELGIILLNKGDTRKRVGRVIEIFGDSLKLTEADYFTVLKHLRDLSRIPESLIRLITREGLKMRIGFFDATAFYNELYNSDSRDVDGFYDDDYGIGYAGNETNPDSSVALHEFGHGVDYRFRSFFRREEKKAHIRLCEKLRFGIEKGGAGNPKGINELMADSFADYFQLSQEKFIRKYDAAWHKFFSEFITPLLINPPKYQVLS